MYDIKFISLVLALFCSDGKTQRYFFVYSFFVKVVLPFTFCDFFEGFKESKTVSVNSRRIFFVCRKADTYFSTGFPLL